MDSIVKFMTEAPLQTVLILVAIGFFYLALGGKFPGQIQIPAPRQKWAAILGGVLLLFSAVLLIREPGAIKQQLEAQVKTLTEEKQTLQEENARLKTLNTDLAAERDQLQRDNQALQAIVDQREQQSDLMLVVRNQSSQRIVREVTVEIEGDAIGFETIRPVEDRFYLPLKYLQGGLIFLTLEANPFRDREEFILKYQHERPKLELYVRDERSE
jgi:hypothetical protein